jgi:hypothetical protein
MGMLRGKLGDEFGAEDGTSDGAVTGQLLSLHNFMDVLIALAGRARKYEVGRPSKLPEGSAQLYTEVGIASQSDAVYTKSEWQVDMPVLGDCKR